MLLQKFNVITGVFLTFFFLHEVFLVPYKNSSIFNTLNVLNLSFNIFSANFKSILSQFEM